MKLKLFIFDLKKKFIVSEILSVCTTTTFDIINSFKFLSNCVHSSVHLWHAKLNVVKLQQITTQGTSNYSNLQPPMINTNN